MHVDAGRAASDAKSPHGGTGALASVTVAPAAAVSWEKHKMPRGGRGWWGREGSLASSMMHFTVYNNSNGPIMTVRGHRRPAERRFVLICTLRPTVPPSGERQPSIDSSSNSERPVRYD